MKTKRMLKTKSGRRVFRQPTLALCTVLAVPLLATQASAQALPYSEDFNDTVFKDAAQTTAVWEDGPGTLTMPSAAALTGAFSPTSLVELLNPSFDTRSIAVADMDGDGDLDLVLGTNGRNGVQLNNGNGSYGARTLTDENDVLISGMNTQSVAVGDVNRDGFLDFVAANTANPSRLYLNYATTGRQYVVRDITNQNRSGQGIALADVNGDGFLDAILATAANQDNLLFLNSRDPSAPFGADGSAGIAISSAGTSQHVVTGDLDLDGDDDIVFLNDGAANSVVMNNNDDPLTFTESPILADAEGSVHGALGDLNGDGYLDLVVVNATDGQASKVYLNDGSGVQNANPFTIAGTAFTTAGLPNVPEAATSVALADADADGDLDIFLTNGSGDRNGLYLNDGSGTIAAPILVGPAGQGLGAVDGVTTLAGAHGDFNGDGLLDWVIGNHVSSGVGEQNIIFFNEGTAGAGSFVQLSAQATSSPIDVSGTVTSVKLSPSPMSTNVGAAFHNYIEYWVTGTNNATNTWTRVMPDGRPVTVIGGSGVRWRTVLGSASPATAGVMSLDQLDIIENTSGPVLGTPYPDARVIQGDDTTGLPIAGSFSDTDGDAVYYTATGLADGTGLAIDPLTGEISGTPTLADVDASPATVTVTATDGAITATDDFVLTALNVHFTSTAVTAATQDVAYTYNITTDDPEMDAVTITAPTLPAWLTFTDNGDGTASLTGTPTNAEVGDHAVSLEVTDLTYSDTQDFTITVANVNDAPSFTSTAITAATEGVAYSYTVTVEDADMDIVAIAATTLPGWLTLTDNGDNTATLAGTPGGLDVGDNSVVLTADDGNTGTAEQSFTITVTAAGDGPVIVLIGDATVTLNVGDTYTDEGATASDPQDGDLTAQIVVDNPVDTSTAGNYTVTYTVQDSAGNMAQAQRTVVVVADDPPTITLLGDASVTLTVGDTYTDAGATASDPQDGDLTAQIVVDNPVDTSTAGTYTVTYTVEDSDGNQVQAERTVTVEAAPPPPPPPPPSGGGGGGSISLIELLTFGLALLVAAAGRRRNTKVRSTR